MMPDQMPHLLSAWQDIIHPDDLAVAIENFEKHFADPSHPYDQVVRYQHRQGHTVWVRCRGLIIRDQDGKPVRMLGAHTEVTELKETQRQLADALAELRRSNHDLNRFASVVAHDLRSPLRQIIGLTEIMNLALAEGDFEETAVCANRAHQGARRLHLLIDGLLEYAREGGSSEQSVVSLAETISTIQDLLDSEIGDASLACDPGTDTMIANKSGVLQVMLNLIRNSLRYRHPDRPLWIRISLQKEENRWVLSVSDNGLGIPPDQIPTLLQPFKTLTRNQESEGIGLGLAICVRVMENAGGRFLLESDGFSGTVATTMWPLRTL